MPLDDETAARFDHMMLPLAQQVAAMAQGENAIDMMLDLYFSFLRRKTDFFSQGEMCERAVQSAFERQRHGGHLLREGQHHVVEPRGGLVVEGHRSHSPSDAVAVGTGVGDLTRRSLTKARRSTLTVSVFENF